MTLYKDDGRLQSPSRTENADAGLSFDTARSWKDIYGTRGDHVRDEIPVWAMYVRLHCTNLLAMIDKIEDDNVLALERKVH